MSVIHNIFCLVPPIEVGYEFSVYTTTEEIRDVEICAVVQNYPTGSPRKFSIRSTTEPGVASNALY